MIFYGIIGIDKNWSIDEVEFDLYNKVNSLNFLPYFQKYEFETLLYANPDVFIKYNNKIPEKIYKIIKQFNGNIKDINNSTKTSPSKRLENIFHDCNIKYDKVYYGPQIVKEIGIEKMRNIRTDLIFG